MRVHLRRTAKEDAVLVDDVHLPRSIDTAENLRRRTAGIVDLIDGHPLTCRFSTAALVKGERRFLSDVQRLPVQYRLLFCLSDDHVYLAVLRRLPGKRGSPPQGRIG